MALAVTPRTFESAPYYSSTLTIPKLWDFHPATSYIASNAAISTGESLVTITPRFWSPAARVPTPSDFRSIASDFDTSSSGTPGYVTPDNERFSLTPSPVTVLEPIDKASTAARQYVVTPAQRRQTVRHFGASDAWATQFVGQWPLRKRQAIAELLFSTQMDGDGRPRGIGLSAWRFNVGAGSAEQGEGSGIGDPWRRAECFLRPDGAYDWGRQAGQRWFLRAAHGYGVAHLTAFANSPPVHLTKSGKAYCTSGSRSNLPAAHAPAFATFLARVLHHLRDVESCPVAAVSPVNEPQWEWDQSSGQEGCHYEHEGVWELAYYLDWQLRASGLPVRLEVPEAAQLGFVTHHGGPKDLLQNFFSHEALRLAPSIAPHVAAHGYNTTFPVTQLVETRRAVRQRLQSTGRGLEYWMTEYCLMEDNEEVKGHGKCADDIGPALYMARVIHFDLVAGDACSWSWWLALSPYDYKDGLIYVDKSTTDGNFSPSKLLWALGHFSRFIRPGAQRLPLVNTDEEDPHADVLVSAYQHVGERTVVWVCVNGAAEARPVQLHVDRLNVSTYAAYVTSAVHSLTPAGQVHASQGLLVPARALVTLVGRY